MYYEGKLLSDYQSDEESPLAFVVSRDVFIHHAKKAIQLFLASADTAAQQVGIVCVCVCVCVCGQRCDVCEVSDSYNVEWRNEVTLPIV